MSNDKPKINKQPGMFAFTDAQISYKGDHGHTPRVLHKQYMSYAEAVAFCKMYALNFTRINPRSEWPNL